MVIIAVVGPTATGKSDLALDLAQGISSAVPAEILNSDAYQMYRGMDIGTAKVPVEQRRSIVHHQIDVLDMWQEASVADFQARARADLGDLAARGAPAVVVGGSGLYVRALLDHMDFPGTDPDVRARLEDQCQEVGVRAIYEQLLAADPVAAHNIGPTNARRLIRALEVIELTGQPYSANLPRQEYVAPAVQIGLDLDRDTLDVRVAQRVDHMFELGLVQEVTELADLGMGRTAERAVGYAELLSHLRGEISLDQARTDITANTRRLARKQMGWFGRDPRVHWLDAADPALSAQALEIADLANRGKLEDPIRDSDTRTPVRRPLGTT